MHEMSVTQSLLEIALRHAEQADAQRITRLNLIIGELASVVDNSVQFYWDIISKETIAAGPEAWLDHPGDIVDMSLADACLTLEHYVDWK